MSSATSTERRAPSGDAGFQPWHFFLLLSMAAATAAVVLSRNAHPAALLLLSGAVVASGLVGWAIFRAVSGFLGLQTAAGAPLADDMVSLLEREKMLTLRAIKELDFDHAMGKVSEADYADISRHLRARAMTLMQDLERAAAIPTVQPAARPAARPSAQPKAADQSAVCGACGTRNDADARFCKSCGGKL